ncbi:hypothetical protein FQA39_LY15740 [Lamprigera yunnana]|nr:hypothetical protein FQA39_LY15740 [Lamprigera yunnana]
MSTQFGLSSFQDNFENEKSTDDLEKELIIAAADADARSTIDRSESTVDESKEEKDLTDRIDHRKVPKLAAENERVAVFIAEKETTQPGEGYGKIIARHYNTLEEKGLQERSESRIFYLRNFHNWIKSMLINEYLTIIKNGKKHNAPIRVMDLGCGKGGDLLKWRKGGITHLICSDIAAVSLDQCKSRYIDMQNRNNRDRNSTYIYSIETIAADFTKVRLREKYKDPSMKLDLVSCQFAFHYGFESLPQAECAMHNASESLQPGGYFIGTIVDANDLVSRVRKSQSNTFGNGLFKVKFECDTKKPPLFGAKYHFRLDGVVDCPEFLIHFEILRKLAKKYGLKLVNKEKFYNFYQRTYMEGGQLMGNMKGLETFPPQSDSSLVGTDSEDYVHAENFINRQHLNNAKLGTLSKSEWEASSLYLTFAFQKVKNTWAVDGTPIYQF